MDKKYLKQVGTTLLTVLVCVGVIAYLCYHMFGGGTTGVQVVPAENATVEEKNEYTAYILRSENVVRAPSSGGVSYRYGNGERVAKGAALARYYSGDDRDDVQNKLVEYDSKISILTRSGSDDGTGFVGTTVIDKEIGDLYSKIMNATVNGDIDFALQQQDELNILLNRRKVLVGTVDGYEEQVEEYSALEEELIASLGSYFTEILASEAGYFYSGVDGYEKVFDPENIDSMTVDDFDAMISADPDTDISGGYPIGKLVTDFKWYVLFEIDVEDMKKYTVGYTYDLVFPYNSDEQVSMALERMITPTEGGRCVLVFSASEAPRNFNYLRSQSVQIIERSYTGYRVPSGAVRVVDGVRGVYVLDGSVVRFRRIHPLTEVDGYIIVEKQDTMDEESVNYDLGYCQLIITEGKDLYDGKIVE